ncbi:ATPase associated with various cellular activities AAA 3 protein [Colletotrichum truncatum]|uniref:ATPase associated with various cellular activities AAA 3 protein n=1 Tax=Colletotrichum truncatum TaxID=5467 RepID=A0ACC3ZIS5_COLTU|nr:ATPase associated with various cellular activities AAA 3 protein [Colletotrichum truncatum]KAF6791851.1 ATPase associated with various cellular activities AAA 3 protein [Colletotrichum truncatum]
MADEDDLLAKVYGLSDLELAALLCLVNREHCIVSTPPVALGELVEELQLIATKIFGLKCSVVECTPQTTLEDFASSILTQQSPKTTRSVSPLLNRNDSYFSRAGMSPLTSVTTSSPTGPGANGSSIANVIVARNLDRASKAVQIQVLELLRTRRIFTRSSVQTAPKQFLFVAALGAESGGQAHVTLHLNDYLFIAHWHDPDDGFPNLDEAYDAADGAETASTESVLKKSINGDFLPVSEDPLFDEGDIAAIAKRSREVQIDVDVLRYQMNIVSYLRMHRAVAGGIEPTATKHLEQLLKCLAPLHKLDFVTPALVHLAVKKVYLHRIRLTHPRQERSMQWGSQLEAIEAILEGVGPEDVIEDVLGMVAAPL